MVHVSGFFHPEEKRWKTPHSILMQKLLEKQLREQLDYLSYISHISFAYQQTKHTDAVQQWITLISTVGVFPVITLHCLYIVIDLHVSPPDINSQRLIHKFPR